MGKKKAEADSDGSNWSDHPSDDESDDEWADDDDDRRGSRGGLQGRGGKSAGKSARRGGGGTSSRSGLAVGGKGSGASGGRAGPDGRASKGQTKAPSAVDDEEDEDVDDIDDDGDDDDDGDGDGGSQDGEATKEVIEEWEFVLPDFPREPSSICWYAKPTQIPSAHPSRVHAPQFFFSISLSLSLSLSFSFSSSFPLFFLLSSCFLLSLLFSSLLFSSLLFSSLILSFPFFQLHPQSLLLDNVRTPQEHPGYPHSECHSISAHFPTRRRLAHRMPDSLTALEHCMGQVGVGCYRSECWDRRDTA
jgi:hypothetical protein